MKKSAPVSSTIVTLRLLFLVSGTSENVNISIPPLSSVTSSRASHSVATRMGQSGQ